MEMIRFAIGLVILICSTYLPAATIYTWVDETGGVHYSQQAPLDVNADKINSEDMEPAKIGTYIPQKKTAVEVASSLEKSAKIINEKDKQQAKELCEKARFSLNILTTHSKLQQQNKDTGETVAMTEEQRQAAIEENTERVSLFCQE